MKRTPRRLPCHIALCWATIIVVGLAGAVITRATPPAVGLDLSILAWFDTLRGKALDRFFMALTLAGSNIVLLPLSLVWGVTLLAGKQVRKAIFLASSTVGASLLVDFSKHLIARPRPTQFSAVIAIPSGHSFPSGHAAQITAFVVAALLLLKSSPVRKGWLPPSAIAGGALLVLVSSSRLYLQVHYPSDVLAGIVLGTCWVIGLAGLLPPSSRSNDSALKP